jgi:E3 ubiquitin-protein ligase HECTD2
MGHKDLMVGDVYDVATSLVAAQSSPSRRPASSGDPWTPKLVSAGSPHIDWKYVQKWYETILHMSIRQKEQTIDATGQSPVNEEQPDSRQSQILEDLGYAIRGSILDMMEHLLLTPQQAPAEPQDVRYLLILLANPLLMSPKENPTRSRRQRSSTLPASQGAGSKQNSPPQNAPKATWNASKQSRVLSLLLGVLSNVSAECHSQIIQWFSRYPEDIFRKQVDMLLSFVNERISLRSLGHNSPRKNARPSYNGFQPTQMFDDMLQSEVVPKDMNGDDWQLKSACKVLQLFVRANDIYHGKPLTARPTAAATTRRRLVVKQLMPTDHFYNPQLDSGDKFNPKEDFDDWEKKEPGLQLSQYPFLLTLSTKMQILEFDAKRKMASKVRQEFFDSIARNTSPEKYFHLKVRRKCMIEDSLTRISEAISSSEGEAKKALKVQFDGEEGIDAGGLRKEWFLLLVRELLDPDVGK